MSRATKVAVSTAGGRTYYVHVASGLLERLGSVVSSVAPAHRYAVIADETVAGHYGETARRSLETDGSGVSLFTFPPGEAHKSRKTWSILTDELLDAGFGRDSAVVALGGGVTGDIAGFVAATFTRGVPVVQVPTSVVAMVDSSVGGKTGVDVRHGKNLVGAFHAPAAVIVDPECLRTLSRARRAEGWVEAVKHGAICDPEYFDMLQVESGALLDGDVPVCTDAVRRSVEIKAEVVSADELEAGRRQVLNFGHTFGHALESLSGFRLSHGEAVALGMVLEAELGERLEVTEPGTAGSLAKALRAIDIALDLPPIAGASALADLLEKDKKVRGGKVRFVLLRGIGSVDSDEGWSRPVPAEVIEETLAATLLRD